MFKSLLGECEIKIAVGESSILEEIRSLLDCAGTWCGYTPTSECHQKGRSLLVVYVLLLTICPSGPPWNEGHRPYGSSRDQCLWDPSKQERHRYRFY